MTRLQRLARHNGLALEYDHGPVPESTLETILRGLGIDPEAEPEGDGAPTRMTVPDDARCHLPGDLRRRPGWGVFGQLYELRSDRNWGIGDFTDLARLARVCGAAGADFLGVNPLHALFLANPEQASPFSPSNRRFLNPLYIAPDALGCAEPDGVARLRAADVVDYSGVVAAKIPALRASFDSFDGDPAFDAFVADGGEALRRHALFETISARQAAIGGSAGWMGWPEDLRDPASEAVAAVAAQAADDLRFHLWLQWTARRQLGEAQAAALASGMRLGLYLDLAVGEAPDGSSTWSGAAAALPGVSVGAPPDMFSQTGQGWGLAAPSPVKLEEAGFEPFRQMIRAQLRDAGALRIDHAMALWQLFLIPHGRPPADGAHLRYPMAAMLRVLAEESRAAEAVVIGEDLGWVPEGFRPAMERANVLAYRIVVFEQTEDGFKPASAYPETAIACLSTHDLPVLSNWWRGDDIARRREHGLVSEIDTALHQAHRVKERGWMLDLVGLDAPRPDPLPHRERGGANHEDGTRLPVPDGEGVGVRGRHEDLTAETDRPDPLYDTVPDGFLQAAHRFIAGTPCLLAGVRLADLVGPDAPTNLPGVPEGPDGYPNWRPRSPTPVDAIADAPRFRAVTKIMREARPR